jgi:hypothetical protein
MLTFIGSACLGLLLFTLLDLSFTFTQFLTLAFMIFPFAAISMDCFLLLCKEKIWNELSKGFVIPEHWKITEGALLRYLKNMPKIRLMRIVTTLVLLLFWAKDIALSEWLLQLFPKFIIIFYLSAPFDWVWKKVFKLKKPSIFIVESSTPSSRTSSLSHEVLERSCREMNPSMPGTIAWLTKRT